MGFLDETNLSLEINQAEVCRVLTIIRFYKIIIKKILTSLDNIQF